jgi:histidinol-phosphate/aromatic aminotransferase/cobyric acid decarboxylase-like protein
VTFDDLDQLLSQARAQEVMDERIKADGVHPNSDNGANQRDDVVFVSDWNGEHPFVPDFLGDFARRTVDSLGPLTRYSHLEEDVSLEGELRQLHRDRYDEPVTDEIGFLPGAGSASFLSTLLFWVRTQGFDRLCYLPPVYNTAIYLIQDMGFRVGKAARDVDFADDPGLRLPAHRCVLWLTDPVWFAGRPVRRETVEEVARWQQRTGSVVIVDGTFQYQQWSGQRREHSADLDPALTYRVVCPTKALAIHGFRFAYGIVPRRNLAEITHLHSRLHGAAGVTDRAFAHRAVAALGTAKGNTELLAYARQRYHELLATNALAEWIEPETGYFVFARPTVAASSLRGMGPECFETRDHPGYLRVNLLSDRAFRHLRSAVAVAAR